MSGILDFAASIDPRIILAVLLGLLDAWAIGEVWLSTSDRRDKWLWSGIVLVCPIIGCLFWFVLGPKAPRGGRAGGDSREAG
jgi:hypothetical protein